MNPKLLIHGWGNTPAQKRKEAEYNKKYYQEHKEKWKKTQSAYEKRVSDTEKLTGKQDANTYSANTKLHIKRTPKKTVDETQYVKDYAKRNQSSIEEEYINEWKAHHPEPDSGNYTKEGIAAYAKYQDDLAKEREFAKGYAQSLAKERAKQAYSRVSGESEDRIQARKLRTQEINDAKAANEAAKAETAKNARNAKLAQRDIDLARYKQEAKKAKAQVVRKQMKEYEAELAMEKNAPLYKKARKFVDGTVEVALDKITGKNKQKDTAASAEKKKKQSEANKKTAQKAKAFMFKTFGVELF